MLAIDTLAEIKHKIQLLVVVRNGKPIEILSYKLGIEIMKKMRLNKFISHNANYSRRETDELIGRGKENQPEL